MYICCLLQYYNLFRLLFLSFIKPMRPLNPHRLRNLRIYRSKIGFNVPGMYMYHVQYSGVTPFGLLLWQAESVTELTLSASPNSVVGQKALFHGRYFTKFQNYTCDNSTPPFIQFIFGNWHFDNM